MADDIVVASPTNDVSGVIKTPPTMIRGAIRAAVADVLKDMPPDKRGYAEIAVSLEAGVNIVTAIQTEDGRWTAVSWFGSNWQGELTAGGAIKVAW